MTCLSDYTRGMVHKIGPITYELKTKTFDYNRDIRLLTDVMTVEDALASAHASMNVTDMAEVMAGVRWPEGGLCA